MAERDLLNDPREPDRKPAKLGERVRDVPTVDAQTILDLQSKNQTVRAQALLTVAEKVVPAINKTTPLIKRDAGYVRDAVFKAFEELGGISAFRTWAEINQTDFYKMFNSHGRELEKLPQTATQINITSNIPANELDVQTSYTYVIPGDAEEGEWHSFGDEDDSFE